MAKEHLQLLGKNICRFITNSKYKQTEIAQQLKVGNSTISKWIRGERTPTAGNLIELAKVLNVDITEFWLNIDTENIPVARKNLLKLIERLNEQQTITVLEVVKSMLPPPEMQYVLDRVSKLSEVKLQALFTLAEAENEK